MGRAQELTVLCPGVEKEKQPTSAGDVQRMRRGGGCFYLRAQVGGNESAGAVGFGSVLKAGWRFAILRHT